METPKFRSKKELFAWMVQNKEILTAEKMAAMKLADAVSCPVLADETIGGAIKANEPVAEDVDRIKVKAVINTTNLLDGHGDVHIPGLWTKSLKENKRVMHLQEHEMKFDHIIADKSDLKAFTKMIPWSELGQDYAGETQALVFESTVKASRNRYMFDEYKAGNVDNHSVGMRYVKIDLAINDRSYPAEFKVWEKYIDKVANRETAEELGYFWPVTEAKLIEGSAVPAGSNWVTPTLENNMKSINALEPSEDTPAEPARGATPEEKQKVINLIKNFKI